MRRPVRAGAVDLIANSLELPMHTTARFATTLATTLAALSLAACSTSSSPVADKALDDAVKVDATSTQGLPAGAKALALPEQRCVEWVGRKKTGKHDGGFGACAGKVFLAENGDLLGIEVTVDTTSLFSDNGMLTGHLKSADFFEVDTYPTASFTSSSVTPRGDGTFEVTGTFDVRGIENERTFTATSSPDGDGWSGEASLVFLRSDHDISEDFSGEDDPIADEVSVEVRLTTAPVAE
jgi:polyisoprenoid-binding protein YceI